MTLEISDPATHEITKKKPIITTLEAEALSMCPSMIKTNERRRYGLMEQYTYILGSDVSILKHCGRLPKGEYEGWKQTSRHIGGRTVRIYLKL
jgi:hypothetical protein